MWVKVVMAETIWLGVCGRECNIVERSAWRVVCFSRVRQTVTPKCDREIKLWTGCFEKMGNLKYLSETYALTSLVPRAGYEFYMALNPRI